MVFNSLTATVSDLRKRYEFLVKKVRKFHKPMVVLCNGIPDIVIMDVKSYKDQVSRLHQLEEEYLLDVAREGIKESKEGKSIKLRKNEKFFSLVK